MTFLPLTFTRSAGETRVPGSVTGCPFTSTLPCRISSAASRREQMPPWAMYLLRGMRSVSAFAGPRGRAGGGRAAWGRLGRLFAAGGPCVLRRGICRSGRQSVLQRGLRRRALGWRRAFAAGRAPKRSAFALRFSSKWRSMASFLSFLAAFFSCLKPSLMALLLFFSKNLLKLSVFLFHLWGFAVLQQ